MRKLNEKKLLPKNCCIGGEHFFNALKAMFTRILFMLHTLISIWRVTLETSQIYWAMCLMFLLLFVETGIVLFARGGNEWKWFCPSVLIYILSVVPPIWLLELNKLDRNIAQINNTMVAFDIDKTAIDFLPIAVSSDDWTLIVEQALLVLIIICRWLMPKGDLTRDQLSSLLLIYLGTASDIVDFFTIMSEKEIINNRPFVFAILFVWTWSLLQFPFTVTATKNDEDELEENEEHIKPKKIKIFIKHLEIFFESEAWGILISVLMQDGPFVIMRLISIVYFKVFTYTNCFFTFKNGLVLALQLYRLISLYYEKKKRQKNEKKVINIWK